jgi:putative transposase
MKDTVFQQLLKPLTPQLLKESTRRFRSDLGYSKLLTWTHLQAMIYAHLNEIKSLEVLTVAINSQKFGLNCEIKRSTLSDANRDRSAECFAWILEQLMTQLPRKLCKDIDKVVRLLDSSPIQLKGRGYEWAKEFATNRCQGLKLHVEYDLQLKSPTRIKTSQANFNDSCMGKAWLIQKDTVYVFDKGYYDFNWWWSIHQQGSYFVTRLKNNAAIKMHSNTENINEFIIEDGTFNFKNKRPRGGKINSYQEKLRRISVYREDKKPLILVTNIQDLPAEKIAELYKARWEIELFFKWIKQNLKLKKFLGKSLNAVKIQLITAIIAYLLVYYFKSNSKDKRRLQLILIWIRVNMSITKKFINYPPPIYEIRQIRINNLRDVHL